MDYKLIRRNSLINMMISIKPLFIFITVLVIIQSYYGSGVKGRNISSKEEDEDLELERQIKILNKTPIKTFETAEGHKIDCVDTYKQPAFDHPALKNHTIQLRPSHVNSHPHKSSFKKRAESLLQTMDCPEGTVPNRRTTKEDLIRIKSFTKSYPPVADALANHQNIYGVTGHHLAVVSTAVDGEIYYGISGDLNSQNPLADWAQSSSSQIWIESIDPGYLFNSLQAGWIVAPGLYNDSGTHLFGYWQGKGSSESGCFDVTCTGFIQIDPKYYLGAHIYPTSFYGDTNEYRVPIRVYQDEKTQNWWLSVTDQDEEFQIGYWPNELLPSLSIGTPTVSWGGAAKPNMLGQGPPMGNGHFAAGSHEFEYACFITNMRVYTVDRNWEDPTKNMTTTVIDKPDCYDLDYYGYVDPDIKHSIQFGGPGGNCGL